MDDQEYSPENKAVKRQLNIKDLLFLPFGCLLQISPIMVAGIFAILFLFGSGIYYTSNSNFFGFAEPPYGEWTYSKDNTIIKSQNGEAWEISYETGKDVQFAGLVRALYPIREINFPVLTHDILVTQGDFSNPQAVNINVWNHKFSWYARNKQPPQGSINLLHTVPINETIYHDLLNIRKGDQVKIYGTEIWIISHIDASGILRHKWQDAGCNSILVKKVVFIHSNEESED